MWTKKMVLHEALTGLLLMAMFCKAKQIMDNTHIEVAALGRPLHPGALYDCHSDTFIPGLTLWDNKVLREHVHVRQQNNTDLKFSSSDSFSEKANLLSMSTSLRASFLAGLVKVEGYLQHTKSSARQSQATLYYSQTTRFEQLNMTELGNITYPQVLQQSSATHMVTAVLYGAQAFIVFDVTASDDEDKWEVKENLHAVVKKVPSFSIEKNGSINMNENETKMTEKISMMVYGDYELSNIPITFTEHVKMFKELSSLLTEEKAVPVRLWLYPLSFLDDHAAKLHREISPSLVSKIETYLEELGEVERRCNDLIRIRTTNDFLDVKKRLQTFQKLLGNYRVAFQDALKTLLPDIRGGSREEQVLANILSIHENSPFKANSLNKWLDNTATELNMLSSYTRRLKDITVVTSSVKLNAILFDPTVAVVICLSFTSLKYEDEYLGTLNDFLTLHGLEHTNHTAYTFHESQPWFTNDVFKRISQIFSLFTSFLRANKNMKGMRFIIASIPDPSNPGASIQLYLQGKLTNPNFHPVSRPPPPILKTQDETLTLTLQKSPTGDTRWFRVEYREVKSGGPEYPWETKDTSDTQISFMLNGLLPKKQYCFRYKAFGLLGFSEPSECVYYLLTHGG